MQGRVNMPSLDVKGRLAVQLHLAIVSINNLYVMHRFFSTHKAQSPLLKK